jgi:hypothetical protein
MAPMLPRLRATPEASFSFLACASVARRDKHLALHASEVCRCAEISAAHWHDLLIPPSDRDRDQPGAADATVRRIEGDPSGKGQIDLGPGMGRSGVPGRHVGIVEIAENRSCAETEMAHDLDEQGGNVPMSTALWN